MPIYRIMKGVEHEEDNSVSAGNTVSPFDYGPEYNDALHSLKDFIECRGHKLQKIDGGLFKHLPGTQGVFREVDCDRHQTIEIWLIRLLTA